MPEALWTYDSLGLLVVSAVIGVVIGLTGMGGGALMTPALILVGIPPTAAVANDLVVNAVNKVIGAGVHWRHGKPNLKIAFWLILGSVPTAYLGAWLVHAIGADDVQGLLKKAIGATLIVASTAYFLRAFFEMSGRIRTGGGERPPALRAVRFYLRSWMVRRRSSLSSRRSNAALACSSAAILASTA